MNCLDDDVFEEYWWILLKNRFEKEYSFCEIVKKNVNDKKLFFFCCFVCWLVEKYNVFCLVKYCLIGKMFCFLFFDCRIKECGCYVEKLKKWVLKNFCNFLEYFCFGCGVGCCLKKNECLKEVNMSRVLS